MIESRYERLGSKKAQRKLRDVAGLRLYGKTFVENYGVVLTCFIAAESVGPATKNLWSYMLR